MSVNESRTERIRGLTELPDEATLIAANHPFFVGILPSLRSLAAKYPDLHAVSDAGFVPWLGRMGITGIPVDTHSNHRYACDSLAWLKMYCTNLLFRLGGTDYRQVDNRLVPSRIVNSLNSGHSVFLAPTGQRSPNASWRPGIGKVLKETLGRDHDHYLAFLLIGTRPPWKAEILTAGRSSRLLESTGLDPVTAGAAEIALGLQALYRQHANSPI